jgi:pimeloyl-ACP methyl ester carboxylesterase
MLRWLKRAMWALLAIFVIGSSAGYLYQNAATARDAARYHPQGRMIDIGGGRRLNIDCQGAGSPTVILESGLGVPSALWADVVKGVAPLTRVCRYDRAGYGYSDAGPMPRTTNAIVEDLEKLLSGAGEKAPYLLVGHSFGGFTIRVFTARHRGDVVGLIFVDSSHPEQTQRMPSNVKRKQAALNWVSQGIPWLSRIGVVRAAYVWTGTPGENTYLESQPKYTRAVISELTSLDESSTQTRAAGSSFGDLPLTVLTAGRDGTGDPAMYALWRNQLQPELAHLSARGRQLIVEDSTHMIPLQKPQAIVDAVREMLANLKQQP